ncbi:MAG: hypothetical protein ACK5H2_11910 [Beutenbergiaceae bacterium]
MIALFDVDTRQIKNTGGWGYMPRSQPYREGVERLLHVAQEHGVPTVTSTCVNGNMLGQSTFSALNADVLFVPMADDDLAWRARVHEFGNYFVEKGRRPAGTPFDPANNKAELFRYNPNIDRLIDELAIAEWIVFGNAMDTCVNRVVANFVARGYRISYIPELMIPSTKCGDCDPEVFKQHVYDRWHAQGIRPMPLASAVGRLATATATV